MEKTPLTPSKKQLNFQPRSAWPKSLPSLAWNGVVFAGTDRSDAIEMSRRSQSFAEVFVSAYPKLGLSELSRLHAALKPFPDLMSQFPRILQHYKLRDSEPLRDTLELLLQAPPEFAKWVDEKGVSVRELAPLRAVGEAHRRQILMSVGRAGPNKTLGLQALEWSVDLLLTGTDPFRALDETAAQWFSRWHADLRQLRYSRRAEQIVELEKAARALALPKDSAAAVVERGDRVGIEVKIFAEDLGDLKYKLEQLLPRTSHAERAVTKH